MATYQALLAFFPENPLAPLIPVRLEFITVPRLPPPVHRESRRSWPSASPVRAPLPELLPVAPAPMALRFLGEGAASRGAPTSNSLISIAGFSSSFCSICPAIGFLSCTSNSPVSHYEWHFWALKFLNHVSFPIVLFSSRVIDLIRHMHSTN
jgi:hypothetical protein